MSSPLQSSGPAPRSVLVVCLGNICRSPTAEGVLRAMLEQAGAAAIRIDSAGTAGWHRGEPPDPRTVAAARRRGYDLSPLRGRAVGAADFREFDLILAMDRDNLAELSRLQARHGGPARLALFLAEALGRDEPVPDPYYGGPEGFEEVLDLVEEASRELARRWAGGGDAAG